MYIKTDKFKSSTLLIKGVIPFEKGLIYKIDLLQSYLLSINSKYPSRRKLSLALQNLYGLRASASAKEEGNLISFSFRFNYLDEEYTSDKNYLDNIKKMIKDLLYKPYLINDLLDEKHLNILKKETVMALNISKERPHNIALDELETRIMPGYTTIDEQIKIYQNVTSRDLLDLYKYLLKEASFYLYNAGSKPLFKEEPLLKDNNLTYDPINVKIINEDTKLDADIKQVSLFSTYSLENLSLKELIYDMRIFNLIIGGTPDSLLFNTIREEKSFVYTVSSTYNIYYKLFYVSAGLSMKNIEDAKKEILNIVEKIDIKQSDLDAAILKEVERAESIKDSLNAIVNAEEIKRKFKIKSLEEYISNIERLSLRDMENIRHKLIKSITLSRGKNERNI